MDKGEIRNFLLLVGGILMLLALAWVFDSRACQQEFGWLAQKQISARHDCAKLLKYRMHK